MEPMMPEAKQLFTRYDGWDLVDAFVEFHRGADTPIVDLDFNDLVMELGEDPATAEVLLELFTAPPLVVSDMPDRPILSTGALLAGLYAAWENPDEAERLVDQQAWVEMFTTTGFSIDATHPQPPTEAVTLYRGSEPDHVHKMAWTYSPLTAARMALRYRQDGRNTSVFAATIPPERLFAVLSDTAGPYSEFGIVIINPGGLDVRRLELVEVVELVKSEGEPPTWTRPIAYELDYYGEWKSERMTGEITG